MPKLVRTISFRITSQCAPLESTLEAYCSALNAVSSFAQSSQTWSAQSLQKKLYGEVRSRYLLKAQMACSVFRQVAAVYIRRDKREQSARRLKRACFSSTAMPLQFGRDWSLTRRGELSICTIFGRIRCGFKIGAHQQRYIQDGWKFGAATLVRRGLRLFLHVSISKDVESKDSSRSVIGVDIGQTYIAVVSNSQNEALFFKGGKIKSRIRHYRRLQKKLRTKGTRGAKRLLKRLSGKQRRFQQDINHCIAKKVVEFTLESASSRIALENLKGISNRVRRCKRWRQDLKEWSFFQLRQFITYKAEQEGLQVCLVNPAHTSQTCSKCQHTEKGQRNRMAFRCRHCDFKLHADLNAARNIAQRASSIKHASIEPGTPSWCPKGHPKKPNLSENQC